MKKKLKIKNKIYNYYSRFKNATQKQLDECFIDACTFQRFDEIKYLLTSPELKIHADVHTLEDIGFAHLSGDKPGGKEIIEYLIFEYNIEKTPFIEEILGFEDYLSQKVKDLSQEYKKMFEARDLKNSLTNELEDKNNTNKKAKL